MYLDNIIELYYQVNIFGLSVTMITIMISLLLFGWIFIFVHTTVHFKTSFHAGIKMQNYILHFWKNLEWDPVLAFIFIF